MAQLIISWPTPAALFGGHADALDLGALAAGVGEAGDVGELEGAARSPATSATITALLGSFSIAAKAVK